MGTARDHQDGGTWRKRGASPGAGAGRPATCTSLSRGLKPEKKLAHGLRAGPIPVLGLCSLPWVPHVPSLCGQQLTAPRVPGHPGDDPGSEAFPSPARAGAGPAPNQCKRCRGWKQSPALKKWGAAGLGDGNQSLATAGSSLPGPELLLPWPGSSRPAAWRKLFTSKSKPERTDLFGSRGRGLNNALAGKGATKHPALPHPAAATRPLQHREDPGAARPGRS